MNPHLISIEEVVCLLKASAMTKILRALRIVISQNVTLCWRDKEKVDCCSRHQTMAGCGTVGAQCPGAPCDIDQWEAGAGCIWPIRRREADNSAAIMILAYFLKRTQLHCCCAQAVQGWGWKDWIVWAGGGTETWAGAWLKPSGELLDRGEGTCICHSHNSSESQNVIKYSSVS